MRPEWPQSAWRTRPVNDRRLKANGLSLLGGYRLLAEH